MDRYVIRRADGLYYVVADDGSYMWDKWPLTKLAKEEAEQILSTYARSTRRRLRIVPANDRSKGQEFSIISAQVKP